MEQKIWNREKKLFLPSNCLKRPETAEEMFGKAWRFQAEYLEMFGKSLEKIWGRQGLASARVCV
jgi:hypothetical protein